MRLINNDPIIQLRIHVVPLYIVRVWFLVSRYHGIAINDIIHLMYQ